MLNEHSILKRQSPHEKISRGGFVVSISYYLKEGKLTFKHALIFLRRTSFQYRQRGIDCFSEIVQRISLS